MRCDTCRHWTPLAPATSDDGRCGRLHPTMYIDGNGTVVVDPSILDGALFGKPGPRLIVVASWGCVSFEAKT